MRVRIIEKIYHRHGRSLGSNISEVRGLGRKTPPNHEANDILSKETHFFVLKRLVMAFMNQYTKLI